MISKQAQEIHDHVQRFFAGHKVNDRQWAGTYVSDLYPDFRVLEIEPGPRSGNWNYVSSGTWEVAQEGAGLTEFMIITDKPNGADALEGVFETKGLKYWKTKRKSVI